MPGCVLYHILAENHCLCLQLRFERTCLDVSIVIVNWNVKGLLKLCLRSIYQSLSDAAFEWEVIVVDNASEDGSLQMVAREFPGVKLVANQSNLGFTKANNQGMALASGRYVLLLNPDTELTRGALATMLEYMEARHDVAALGPQLLFADGTVQSSRRRFPTFLTGFIESTVLQRFFPEHSLLKRYYVLDRSNDEVQEVNWVVGACMLVRREAIDEVGVFDEQFFMYSEELDWCFRMEKAGWKIVYLPLARVLHYEARSSEQNVLGRNIHFHDSKCKFFSKHHGAWKGMVLRMFIVLTLVFQVVEDGLKLILVVRNRRMRKQRMAMLTKAAGWHLVHIVGGRR